MASQITGIGAPALSGRVMSESTCPRQEWTVESDRCFIELLVETDRTTLTIQGTVSAATNIAVCAAIELIPYRSKVLVDLSAFEVVDVLGLELLVGKLCRTGPFEVIAVSNATRSGFAEAVGAHRLSVPTLPMIDVPSSAPNKPGDLRMSLARPASLV